MSVDRLPDGGRQYNYEVNGQKAFYVVPPPAFKAATASPEQLAAYGIPIKPSDAKAAGHWTRMVANLKFATPPAFLVQTNSIRFDDSSNWSGYVAHGSFSSAEGDWNEPSVGSSCTSNGEGTWTGLGGWNSGNLGQNGTAMGSAIPPGLQQHQGWTEILPAGPVEQNIYATPGQGFEARTSWSSPYYNFYFHNDYTGATLSFYMGTGGSGVDGSTADFIAEWPGGASSLTNFGTLSYNFALANSNSINQYSDTNVRMVNYYVDATTSSLNTASFTVTYQNCD